LIEAAADSHEPHRIAFYLYDLASEFHAWYHTGRDDPALRMVVDDEAITKARLALARVVAIVIASGLEILGVTPVNEMR
jgi:arginyl-tRNA synthetase